MKNRSLVAHTTLPSLSCVALGRWGRSPGHQTLSAAPFRPSLSPLVPEQDHRAHRSQTTGHGSGLATPSRSFLADARGHRQVRAHVRWLHAAPMFTCPVLPKRRGSSEGQADQGPDRGPDRGGEDVMEASISYCGRLVFTAKFPSIHGHTATTRTNGSSGVSRDAGASHATPAYAAAASEQAAGPNREWMEDNLTRDVARSGVRIATCETTPRPRWSTPPWVPGQSVSGPVRPALASRAPLPVPLEGDGVRPPREIDGWWSTPTPTTPTRTVPWYDKEAPVLSSLSERAGSCGCPILACSRYRAWTWARRDARGAARSALQAAFSGQLTTLQLPLQCCLLHKGIYKHLESITASARRAALVVMDWRGCEDKGAKGEGIAREKEKGGKGKGKGFTLNTTQFPMTWVGACRPMRGAHMAEACAAWLHFHT